MKSIIAILLFSLSLPLMVQAQNGYFVTFTDKNNTPFSVDQPADFLSQRAIERRQKQNILISEEDLPVNPAYTDSLQKAGIHIKHTSKWLNGAIVFADNEELMDTLDRVSFVKSVDKTKTSIPVSSRQNKLQTPDAPLKSAMAGSYGMAWDQIRTINAHKLHEQNYKGEGLLIAVIDAGFYGVDDLPVFRHLWNDNRIIGTKDFVNPQSDIFTEHAHGMNVLSIIGGKDNDYIGTAPEASFWLLRTEDEHSEYPIEADYWVSAAEFADSAGVDIINTSLGYYEFDDPSLNYTYDDLNGLSRASRAADIAASKGMLIITSAGNEGNKPWKYIGIPADSKESITVGAIKVDSTKANFSSFGPTADGRIKPDVSAMGVSVAVQHTNGTIQTGSGTSFSTPVVTGAAACLWQALPDKSASEIRTLIIEQAHQSQSPDNNIGYGIPNFERSIQVNVNHHSTSKNWQISPNPFKSYFKLRSTDNHQLVRVDIYDIIGNHLYSKVHRGSIITIDEVAHFKNGIYIVIVETDAGKQHFKTIKTNN